MNNNSVAAILRDTANKIRALETPEAPSIIAAQKLYRESHKLAWTKNPLTHNRKLYNLIAKNESLLTNILNISRREFEATITEVSNPEKLQQLVEALMERGLIDIPSNKENLETYKDLIGKAFDNGLEKVRSADKPIIDTYREILQNGSVNTITNVTDEQKQQVSQILTDAIENKTMPADYISQLSDKVGLSEARAGTIARTEMMNTSNMASWAQNKAEGATHFVVDSRAEACEECSDTYDNETFTIDQTDMLPPLHPNCACVPMFFYSEEDAQGFADEISTRNEEIQQYWDDKGVELPSDGSGPTRNRDQI